MPPKKRHVRPRLWGGLSSSSDTEFDLMLPGNKTDTLCDIRERINYWLQKGVKHAERVLKEMLQATGDSGQAFA